ncbi:MAG: hydantoinase/oxoprolinase family protein, partial [Desulfomonilaceae bacterium]
IVRINKMGLLQVGPDSAGADPGPVCYGLGGENPTVTDADLTLGYLDPNYFLGGAMLLDLDAAHRAIDEKIAKPLNAALIEAAFGIHDLINETMAAAAKTHIAEKGGNPNSVTLTAFGGAGPVHAYGLARKIGAPRIIVPPLAGVGSALGFFTAPVAFDLIRSHRVGLDEADFNTIERLFKDLEKESSAILKQSGEVDGIIFARSIDMRFVGQGAETNLPVANKAFNEWKVYEIRSLFDQAYKRLYGRTYPDTRVELISFRVRASLPQPPFQIPRLVSSGGSLQNCIKGKREAFSLIHRKFIPFTVVDRLKLFPGATINGPAIIEERESTIVVGEDANAKIDEYGFVWITFSKSADI